MRLKYLTIFILLIFINTLFGQKNNYGFMSFNTDWKFHKGGAYGAEQVTFDDSKWRNIDIPHDWSIENLESTNSPFNPNAHTQVNGGFTTGGTGWYRKTFKIAAAEDSNKITIIQFDGVYMNAEVYVNGVKVGSHPYGYSTFQFDITPYLYYDSENIIAVKVKNLGENSRWYSGSGIYRHVWLIHKNRTHIKPWGYMLQLQRLVKQKLK